MSIFGSIGGAIGGNTLLNMGMDIWKQDKAEGQQDHAQNFSADQARLNREFQERMSSTTYQRAVKDLQAAGINPMMAAHGMSSPMAQGNAPQGTAGSTPGRANYEYGPLQVATAANIESQAALNRELALKTEAEKREVEARIPTHEANIKLTLQKVAESMETINNLVVQQKHGTASAANLEQQTRNLIEEIPKIQAMARQLRVLADLNHAQIVAQVEQAGLHKSQAEEIIQRVRANLPEIERAVRELEEKARRLDMPRRGMDAAAHDSFAGALGALLRALNPLNNYVRDFR